MAFGTEALPDKRQNCVLADEFRTLIGAGKADKIDSWPRCPQKWALGVAFIVVKLPQFVFCQTLEWPKVMQSAH